MNFLKGKKLPIGHFFLALGAGLMFFLLPNEAKVQCEQPYWELYVLSISVVISVVLLMIVKKYEAMGVTMLTASSLLVLRFIFEAIGSLFGDSFKPLSEELNLYDMISWVVIWFVPFVITVTVKLFAVALWNTKEKREGFSRFLFLSGIALSIIYFMIIFCKIIFPLDGALNSGRTFVLVPLMRIIDCITGAHTTGILYIIWHCIILIPIGFFMPIYIKKINIIAITLTGIGVGAFLELCQLILNTGSICFDDILMYTLGAIVGYGLKLLIEKTRSVLTLGHDKNMLEIQYSKNAHQ